VGKGFFKIASRTSHGIKKDLYIPYRHTALQLTNCHMFQQTLARKKNRNIFLIIEADTSCHMRASQLAPTKRRSTPCEQRNQASNHVSLKLSPDLKLLNSETDGADGDLPRDMTFTKPSLKAS